MIIDGFMFFNEVDILHMRLEELYPVVDKFILVQAHHTFRGVPREKIFRRDDPLWAPYIDKIEDYTVGLSGGSGPWEREAYQRNVISTVMHEEAYYAPDTICIISDADEIPRREVIASLDVEDLRRFPARLEMRAYYYALNVRVGNEGSARVLLADDLTSAEEIRHSDPTITIPNAGWHFSYMGDADFISNKISSFSHSELDTPAINNIDAINDAIRNHRDLYGRGDYVVETIDDTWPHAVRNNPEKWSKHIWQ